LEHAALAGPVVAGLGTLLHVAAAAERLVAGTGEDHAPHLPVRPRGAERGDQLLHRVRRERVVALRAVDRDDRRGVLLDLGAVVEARHRTGLPARIVRRPRRDRVGQLSLMPDAGWGALPWRTVSSMRLPTSGSIFRQ